MTNDDESLAHSALAQSRRDRWTLVLSTTALALLVSACGSGGLAHTVPDDAMKRVTGEDSAQLVSGQQAIARAQESMSAIESEKGNADDAVSAAQGEVKDAERALDELEDRRKEIEKQIETAKAKVEWRREERKLADLKYQVAEAGVLAAKAEHELAKFRVVGRVEMGGEDKFQERLKDFEAQLAEKRSEEQRLKDKLASQEREVASMGSRF